jgi:hypothetical protein
LGGDQGFHPDPPTQGYFDRVEAPQAVEQLEQILLEKGRVHAEFQGQRAAQARANVADQFAHEALRALPGRFLSLRIWPVCARWASSG